MDTCDVVVVGKGMMGAAAARHLARSGASVTLIGPDEPAQRRTHRGVFGSHYDSGRITRSVDEDPDWARLARASIARYAQIEAESGTRFYTEAGCVIAAPESGEAMATLIETRDQLGIEARHLDRAALQSAFPALHFAGGHAGLHEARGAGTIDPRAMVAAQVRLAEASGARVVAQEAVAIRDHGTSTTVETADGSTFSGARAIVSVGGYSIRPRLLPRRLDLTVKARTVLMAEIDERDAGRYAAMPSVIVAGRDLADSFYVLPPIRYPDGRLRIKIGGDPIDRILDDEDAIRAWFRGGGDALAAAHLRRHLQALLPDLIPTALSTASCVTTFTRHGYPYIGFAGTDRVVVLTGGNGAAAKSSDEIGRLGAHFAENGSFEQSGYETDFAVCFTQS